MVRMFDWGKAIKDEADGVEEYTKLAEEMKLKYPHKLYSLQFSIMARDEAKHKKMLEKMMIEIQTNK